MLGLQRSEAVGRKWRFGISVAIVMLGALFVILTFAPPPGSTGWVWGFALLLYIPFVLVGAAMLKYMILIGQRIRRILR